MEVFQSHPFHALLEAGNQYQGEMLGRISPRAAKPLKRKSVGSTKPSLNRLATLCPLDKEHKEFCITFLEECLRSGLDEVVSTPLLRVGNQLHELETKVQESLCLMGTRLFVA